MPIPSRTLSLGLSGTDVRDTQTALTQLGYNIPAADRQALTFGQATHDAVASFQTAIGLPATGTVDAATATAIAAAVAEATYTAIGTVSSPSSAGVGGLTVTLVDKNVGGDVTLGTTATDARGGYTSSVMIALPTLAQRKKTAPDLQARVSSGTVFLAASEVVYNAPSSIRLDVALPASAALPSEYETLTAALANSYGGSLMGLQENAARQDVTYLANKTGWDARAVALASLAAQFAAPVPAPPAGTAPAPVPVPTLRPEFYYALFRAGLPASADTLYQADAKTVSAVWTQAVAQGVIPAALAAQIPAAVATYQGLAAAAALTAKPAIGVSPIKDLLQVSLPDAKQQAQFAQLYAQNASDTVGLWNAATQVFGADVTARLRLDGQLAYMTLNNAPLLTALHAAEKANPLASAADLATKGYYTAAKWQNLIGASVPAQIPGATPAEQAANYAGLLAAQVRIAFPTLVIADLVRQAKLPVQSGVTVATGVATFLTANQGKFEIGIEPVEAYIARSKITGTAPDVVAQVKRLQRVYQLTPDDQSMTVLLQANLDSAVAIMRYDATGFAASFGTALGGAATAASIYARARQIHGSVLGIVTHYLAAQRAPVLGGSSRSPILDTRSTPDAAAAVPVAAYPTLETLLGSMDYCRTEDCRSILSPAAYLVDLLHFIDCPTPDSGFQNPQNVLLTRRPDLQQLLLTCANTNTALPYIDLVNETLEYFVAHNCSLNGFAGFNTADGVSSAELLATPQNVNDAAYGILQMASFPAPLPFHRPLTMLRAYLQAIGVTLFDAMRALRASDAVERGTQLFGWRDILMERLGFSREEYRLLTDSSLGLHGLYGYPSLTEPAALALLQNQSLQDFSRRLAVSYDDLFAILQTTLINPSGALIPLLQLLQMPFATLQKLQNGTLSEADFAAALPAGIDARAFGATAQNDPAAIAAWVKSNYPAIMAIIDYTNPTDPSDLCAPANLLLRYSNPDNTANLLHGADFLKLIRFIRLWRKLGLEIGQVDALISALYPAADLPTGAGDPADYQLLDAGFLILLPRLGFLYQAMDLLGIDSDALPSLLACWAPLDAAGAGSLYAAMFLSPTVLLQDPAFARGSAGRVLQDAGQKLAAHESSLCAAFNITGEEFARITAALGFDATTVLNLANISAVYRFGWLARTLRLSVIEFIALRHYSGLNPFAPLDPSTTAPAEPPAIRFIRLAKAIGAAGLETVQALYLLWNQDLNGKATPPDSAVTGLAAMLRSAYAAVETQFTLVDDPDGSIAKAQMALVYGAAATDFFFGLLNNSVVTAVPFSAASGAVAQPILDSATGRLSYDELRKQLAFAGVLEAASQSAIDAAITANGNDAGLHAALAALAAANHLGVDPFFAAYPELLPLYAAYAASGDSLQVRRTTLLAGILPSLKQKRKEEQAAASISAVAAIDSSYAAALLPNPSVLHAAARGDLAAITDLTALEAEGLAVAFHLTDNLALPPDLSVDTAPAVDYSATTAALPPGQGGGAITGVWSGFLSALQDGFYDISVEADAGAAVTLAIGGTAVPMAAAGNVWSNQTAISLTAGALTEITLSVAHVKAKVSLSWRSQGIGWQIIPGASLYSAALVDSLRATYLRFLKATSLAQALSLDADEIAALGTAPANRIATSDGHDKLTLGNSVFTPLSMLNIRVGSVLVIDAGAAQEAVTVTATTPGTFSAATTKAHDGTVQPFPILGQPLAAIGKGWLNSLPVAGSPDTATATALRDVLGSVLDYIWIRSSLGIAGERLLTILQAPDATNSDGSSLLLTATGWSLPSLQALLQQFFGDTSLANLAEIGNLRRVADAYAVVSACRVPAAALIAATGNAPDPAGVAALQSALRALYVAADWLTVCKPINDAIRQAERDALVAFVLQQLGDLPPGSPPSPDDLRNINTADKLYEYLLIDPQTEPAVETSRIRLALSAIQIFIERCQRNLELKVSPANVNAAEWTWMKRYRVWQANREIFLWPENWLYPELRDDQSPFFQKMMSGLLQGDITDDAAESAYLDYLSDLESVAKLELCGLYYVAGDPGKSNENSYVVGRTAGAHRKYYFRELANASWSPWTEMKIDPDDLPVTPIVWNGRLLVFWLKVMKKVPISAPSGSGSSGSQAAASMTIGQIQGAAAANAGVQTRVTMSAALCWSEYYNGKWQATKSSDVNRPTYVCDLASDDASFDANRAMLRIEPAIDTTGALLLSITSQLGNAKGGFLLYNTHSLPVRIEEASPSFPLFSIFAAWRNFSPIFPYTGGSLALAPIPYVYNNVDYSTFTIEYGSGIWINKLPRQSNKILKPVLIPRVVPPQGNVSDVWDAPFFYEDRRNVFYVKTSEALVNVWQFTGFGAGNGVVGGTLSLPPLLEPPPPARPNPAGPVSFGAVAGGGDAVAMQQFVARDPNIRTALGTTQTVTFQGQEIGAKGSAAASSATSNRSA
jgi:hypothetical protein